MATYWPQVVLFGDSLFQRSFEVADGFSFYSALQSQCLRRLDVINRGLSGYSTSMALKVLADVFPPKHADGAKMEYLFVLFGANDAAVIEKQHVPLETFKANLAEIVTHPNIAAHRPKIFLVTPPPLNEMQLEQWDLAQGHPAVTRHAKTSACYSQAVREVGTGLMARGLVTGVIDLYEGIMARAVAMTPGADGAGGRRLVLGDPESGVRGYLDRLLSDGLHLSGEGYRILYDLVRPHVGAEWAHAAATDETGFVLPGWANAMMWSKD